MNNNEGPIVEFPGISVLETVVTFFILPTVMFVVISVLAYAMSKPRRAKTSSITSIE
jgi:large-conductance mechanosensitive channel